MLESQRGGRYQRPVVFSSSDWWRRIQIVQREARPGANEHPDWELDISTLTDRARVEDQPHNVSRDWVKQLIERSVPDTTYHKDEAITLFELLVPDNLKYQVEPVSLILDNTTAQFPWELLAERSQPDKPVATQIGLLRQFKARDYRENPQRARQRNVLVVGDTDGHTFGELPGAQDEARQVSALLRSSQYEVISLIREPGLNVLIELFAREYQILHIAAHGTFGLGRDKRQGIVLGDGQYLTTTELVQLRAVPDLVFINCCHLGKPDTAAVSEKRRLATPYPHRLAASIAEEFFKIGVKAVIAAGWAVDDSAALTFATEFYRRMLDGARYGEAVLKARQKTHQLHRNINTWGAYQCYGHPAFRLAMMDERQNWNDSKVSFYSRREFRDEIRSLAEQPEASDPSQNSQLIRRVKKVHEALPDDLKDGEMLAELADAWRELGHFDKAAELYETAVVHQDARASLRNVEHLANLLCQMTDREWYEAESQGGVLTQEAQQKRLIQLRNSSAQLQ